MKQSNFPKQKIYKLLKTSKNRFLDSKLFLYEPKKSKEWISPFQEAVLKWILKLQNTRYVAWVLGSNVILVDNGIEALCRKNYLKVTQKGNVPKGVLQRDDISAAHRHFKSNQ